MNVQDDIALLTGNNGKIMAIIPISKSKMESGRHAYLPVRASADLIWIPYVSSLITAQNENSIIAHIVLPVDDLEQAIMIKKSISFGKSGQNRELSFTYNGDGYSYRFEQGTEGLVLKK